MRYWDVIYEYSRHSMSANMVCCRIAQKCRGSWNLWFSRFSGRGRYQKTRPDFLGLNLQLINCTMATPWGLPVLPELLLLLVLIMCSAEFEACSQNSMIFFREGFQLGQISGWGVRSFFWLGYGGTSWQERISCRICQRKQVWCLYGYGFFT